MRSWARWGAMVALVGLAACDSRPVNSPYADNALAQNTLHTTFISRSPRTLDPARSYSADETPYTYNIYEPLYGYHYLKRPYELIPRAAEAVSEPSYYDAQGQRLPADAPGEQVAESVYDIKIRPGIQFQPHPAFALREDGQPQYWPMDPATLKNVQALPDFAHTGTRELTAHDFVYAMRRLAHPRLASPIYSVMAEHVQGMAEYGERLKAVDAAQLAEYRRTHPQADPRDLPWLDLREHGFDGVQALDDHTLRIRVKGKYPQFKYWLAMTFVAPIPWEAERFYAQPGMAERDLSLASWPVGTGPFYLTESLRNRRHVLSRNPNFRGEPYPCEGEPDDEAKGLLADCGKMTPFVDQAVFTLEKEAIPLVGKFMQGYYDLPQLERGELGVAMRVAAGDSADKAAQYAERGIQLPSTVETTIWYMGFNWDDPIVGEGQTPEQAERNRKLRQAISIAFDWEEYVALFENDQAMVAQGPVPPGVLGYEEGPDGVNTQVYDIVDGKAVRKSLDEARRLLAEAGYPDGRDAQSGAPLVLFYDSMTGVGGSPTEDWFRRQLGKLGVQLEVRATDFNRFQDKMRNGSAQLFLWGWVADYPDAENFLFMLYGPNGKAAHGGENAVNYRNPAFDAMFERMRLLDDGPEKAALIKEMVTLLQHDAPWMFGYFPMSGGAYHQWLHNAKPTQMVRNNLPYLRVDVDQRLEKTRQWNAPTWWPLWLILVLAGLGALGGTLALRRRDRQAQQREGAQS